MRNVANRLVTTSLVTFAALAAMPAKAANIEAASTVDAVTVYPDGASVTRAITADVPSGDNTLVIKDFPLTLDPSSLRVEGEAGAKLTIGTIDTRPPRAAPPVNLSELGQRIEALKDERANLQGAIAAATARRKFAERFAETSPAGIGEKGEARPIADWRAAFAAVAEEVATADSAIRDAERKQREIDREISRLESDRATKPPSKLEVRIDLTADAAARATLRVTYAVRGARWTPLYDARLDTGAKDGPQARARAGAPRRDRVKVERLVVKRNEGSAGLILATSKTDERLFKTVIRNGHDFPIRIAIEDQLPVSENEDIQVEMLPSTTPPAATNLRDRRGVLEWAFEAKAGEVRDIAFAWRVRWPKDKGVVMMPAG